MMRSYRFLMILLVLLPVTAFCAEIQPPTKFTETGKVVKVVDGDTVDVSISGQVMRLRLIGLNTPETKDPRKPVECFGKEASDQAKKLLNGKTVSLETDPTQGNVDKYNRFLRFLWIDGKILYNLQMIQDGYAFEYTYNLPYKYQEQFKQAQRDAREKERGLWNPNACGGELKPVSEQPQTEQSSEAPTPTPKSEKQESKFSCSPKKTCNQMSSCEEAYFHLRECGNRSLDRDKDGIPCESICR